MVFVNAFDEASHVIHPGLRRHAIVKDAKSYGIQPMQVADRIPDACAAHTLSP